MTRKDDSEQFCLVVPESLRQSALHHAHVQSGHLGQKKTLTTAESLFFWCNMKTDVCNYVKTCSTCQQLKHSAGLQQQWQEMPAVDKPLERVSMDIVDMVGGTQGFRYVLTVLDHYSRYTKLFPLKTKATEGVCEAFSSYIADFGQRLLPACQKVLNLAVHTTTGEQPYFAFFSRRPPCQVGVRLPEIEGTEEGIAEAHAISGRHTRKWQGSLGPWLTVGAETKRSVNVLWCG